MLSRSKLFNTFLPAPFMWLKLLETLFGLRFLLLLVIEQIAKKDIFKAIPHFYGSRIRFFWPLATGEHCLFLQVLGHRGISGMEKFKSKDVFRKVWQKFATKIKHNSSNWPKIKTNFGKTSFYIKWFWQFSFVKDTTSACLILRELTNLKRGKVIFIPLLMN